MKRMQAITDNFKHEKEWHILSRDIPAAQLTCCVNCRQFQNTCMHFTKAKGNPRTQERVTWRRDWCQPMKSHLWCRSISPLKHWLYNGSGAGQRRHDASNSGPRSSHSNENWKPWSYLMALYQQQKSFTADDITYSVLEWTEKDRISSSGQPIRCGPTVWGRATGWANSSP